MQKNKVYVITHKKIDMVYPDNYEVLLVGADKNDDFENNYTKDNTGDNISARNNSYCELTGLYWVWKNVSMDCVGMVHYRRVFAELKPHFDFKGRHIFLNTKNSFRVLEEDDICRLLEKADIIVKSSEFRMKSNEKIFRNQLGKELFDYVCWYLKNKESSYYDTYRKVLKQHHHINCNMFIGSKKIVDCYCEWLFPILQDIDDKRYEKYGRYYANREIGYISELLFEVWLDKNDIKYIIQDVVFLEDKYNTNGIMNIREMLEFIYNKVKKKVICNE